MLDSANDAVNLVIAFIPLGSQRVASRGRVTKVTLLLLLGVTEARRLAWRSGYSECVDGISEVSGEKSVLSAQFVYFLGQLTFPWFANRVADIAHGMNQRRIANFLSQPSDENLHEFRVVFILVFPDLLA